MNAIDLIVGGQCVNAFCATRPPGHHAGRNLHPMGAVSNGFCVLNPVACAAIYATTPPSEGGLGLKRAVVIDFDVHHGNGTQDILCSTYDPRFLYISMHAGGAHINGYETDDSDVDIPRVGNKKQEGIFPGRCGDTSPHKGVLNLPLGPRVTPHDVGNALVTLIEPALEAFSPDIIILSAGFDGHKNDPLGMGGLSAHDFGHITEVACAMAFRFCSGRIMSVLEGGYGIPCCRPQKDVFLPTVQPVGTKAVERPSQTVEGPINLDSTPPLPPQRSQPFKLLDLGDYMPQEMDDQVTPGLQRKLEKCHTEGFLDCVREHVISLKKNNSRS
jgi:acetoin utilization deacetylase AcuC-like enzyme